MSKSIIKEKKIMESNVIIDENDSAEELKSKLVKKLKNVIANLDKLKIDLTKNMKEKSSTISLDYKKYLENFKDNSEHYIKDKEKTITDKELLNSEYEKFVKKIQNLEQFNKNLSNILLNSIQNYNDFFLDKRPFYKDLASKFLINRNEQLSQNNIFCKLNEEQIFKISDKLKNKNILYLINGKSPLDLKISGSSNLIEAKSLLDSTIIFKNNKIELNGLNDEEFKLLFNKYILNDDKKFKQRDLAFQNCELKTIHISDIPYYISNLIIFNSGINSSIFLPPTTTHSFVESNQLQYLISLILDNCKLDTDNFENIFTILLKKENNLKKLSARNNNISRIIKKEELGKINNKLNSLEILNLSNNYICDFNKNIFDLVPNLKILDLSNNSISQEYKCIELIKNFKGIVLLLRNIGIMKEKMNEYYKGYYFQKLKESNFPLYSLNLNSLFYKKNYESILKVDFTNIKKNTNILELNLSSCNIDDKTMINIISNCSSVNNNINKLNLSFNLLTANFFDLLIKNNLNLLLNKLIKLNLSFNNIRFIGQTKKKEDNSKNNQFVIFLKHFPQMELILLKGTEFEQTFNDYIKKKVISYYDKDKKHQDSAQLVNEYLEIDYIINNNSLEINPKFIFVINDVLPIKYSKKVKIVLSPLFFAHIVIDNLKQEEKK